MDRQSTSSTGLTRDCNYRLNEDYCTSVTVRGEDTERNRETATCYDISLSYPFKSFDCLNTERAMNDEFSDEVRSVDVQERPSQTFAQKLQRAPECPVNLPNKKFQPGQKSYQQSSVEGFIVKNTENVGGSDVAISGNNFVHPFTNPKISRQLPLESDENLSSFVSIVKFPTLSVPKAQVLHGKSRKKIKSLQPLKLPPQDSRICIIDSSLKKKWMGNEEIKEPLTKQNLPFLDGNDFPDLTSALKILSKCVARNTNDEEENASSPSSKDEDSLHRRKIRKKQPQKKDPISLNILDIIKKASGEHMKSNVSRIKNKYIVNEVPKKLAGNFLDSSNPIRKRGKHRERPPKKRLSKLKNVIMNERKIKQEQREILMRNFDDYKRECDQEQSVKDICENLASLNFLNFCLPNSTVFPKKQQEDDSESCLASCSDNQGNQGNQPDKAESIAHTSEIETYSTNDTSANEDSGNIDVPCQSTAKPSFHSRKFREYCNNIRSKELDEAVTNLLKEIYRFQDRHFKRDPIRAHAKRRFVLGIREVKKYMMLKKLKAVVIAPDLEPVKAPGGLDEVVIQIREDGKSQHVPVIFAAGRRQLGFALMKKVPISVVGLINPEGAEELYSEMLVQWQLASEEYQKLTCELYTSTSPISMK